jgi:hypothetical protein
MTADYVHAFDAQDRRKRVRLMERQSSGQGKDSTDWRRLGERKRTGVLAQRVWSSYNRVHTKFLTMAHSVPQKNMNSFAGSQEEIVIKCDSRAIRPKNDCDMDGNEDDSGPEQPDDLTE